MREVETYLLVEISGHNHDHDQPIRPDRLRNISYSTGVDLEGETKKDAIIDKLADEEVRLTQNGWMHGDDEFELKESVSQPSDENVLYGFRRSGATDEIMEEIQELFDDTRFELRILEETQTNKEPMKVVIPADESEDSDE